MLSQIFHLGEATGGREIPGLGLGGDARAALRGFVRVGGEAGRILLLPPAGPPCGEVAPRVGPWRCQAAPGTHGCPRAGRYSPCPVHFGSWQQPRAALKVENAGAWCGAALRWCWAGGAALALSPPPPAALWCTGRQRGPVLAPLPRSPIPCNPQEGVQPPQNPIPPIDPGCPIPSLAPTTHPKAGAAPGSHRPPSAGGLGVLWGGWSETFLRRSPPLPLPRAGSREASGGSDSSEHRWRCQIYG